MKKNNSSPADYTYSNFNPLVINYLIRNVADLTDIINNAINNCYSAYYRSF